MSLQQQSKKTSDIVKELVDHLEKNEIVTENEWKTAFPESYEKMSHLRDAVLTLVRKRYCSFSLYQTLLRDSLYQTPCLYTPILKEVCELEGFNMITFAHSIASWLWSYSFVPMKPGINTLYIVGGPNTAAQLLCSCIVHMFKCVVTCNMNNLDFESIKKRHEEVKLLYFPPIVNGMNFGDPIVNHILTGREVPILTENGPQTIEPIKCLVHLHSLPLPHRMPTNPKQHVIINFKYPADVPVIYGRELMSLIKLVADNMRDLEMVCLDPYNVLCSDRDRDGIVCTNCNREYSHHIFHPSLN